MRPTILRPCEVKDLPELVALCAMHAEYERVDYEKQGKQERLQKALFDRIPALYCLVVESENKVVGYASYTLDFSTWEAHFFLHLDTLYLLPSYRRMGLGKQILLCLRQIAKEKGCTQLQWQTPSFNVSAIQFYHRMGACSKAKRRFCWDIMDSLPPETFQKGKV